MEILHNPYKLTDDTRGNSLIFPHIDVLQPSAHPDKVSGFPHQELTINNSPTSYSSDYQYLVLGKLDTIISLLERMSNEISPIKLKNY